VLFLFIFESVEKRTNYQLTFSKFVPECFSYLLAELLVESGVHFKIVKGRKTKWGDFRPRNLNGKPQITVNGDLNPYAFLITTLHEFAHLHTFQQVGLRVAPHGTEWKRNFQKLIAIIIDHPELPPTLRAALNKSFSSLKASSCTDIELSRALASFDQEDPAVIPLEKLPKNSKFVLNNRMFQKGLKRRTRFECIELSSNRTYLVHLMAKVQHVKDEE
jgi:hypothetical protein